MGSLPKGTPIALYVPRLDTLLSDLQIALDQLRTIDAEDFAPSLGDVLAKELGKASIEGPTPWSVLFTPAGLDAMGIDPLGPAMLVPSVTDEAVVVAFQLKSRARFEAALVRLGEGESRRLEIAGEQASVLEPSSNRPITCLSRQAAAYCQIGIASGADPVLALRTIAARSSPTLEQVHAVLRTRERLPDGAHAYAVIQPEPLSRALGQLTAQHAQRDHRFDNKDRKRAAEAAAEKDALRLRHALEGIESAAIAMYVPEHDVLAFQTELMLTEKGARRLHELAAKGPGGDRIQRWSETPALARLLVHLNPEKSQRVLEALGFTLPEGALSGTFALLWFGIDTECAAAKKNAEVQLARPSLGWAFLLPSALALGIRSKETAPGVRDALLGPLKAEAADNPLDVRVIDDLVFVGTGPGSGAAAVRRLEGLPPGPPDDVAGKAGGPPPLLEGSIHLRAVDAALESADFGADRRRELLFLNSIRHHMKPLLEQVAMLDFRVRGLDLERRVRVDLAVKR